MKPAIAFCLWIAVVCAVSCARVFPTTCQPGAQLRDFDKRIHGVNDCYICADASPGALDSGDHYRCLDSTCDECEAPFTPGMFGKHARDGGAKP